MINVLAIQAQALRDYADGLERDLEPETALLIKEIAHDARMVAKEIEKA